MEKDIVLILMSDLEIVSKKDLILVDPLFSPRRRLYEPEANIPVFHHPTAFFYGTASCG
jgi:hypothetical protein